MLVANIPWPPWPDEFVALLPKASAALLLALFWSWETWRPFFGHRDDRRIHAVRNLGIALVNTLVVNLGFGFAIVAVADGTARSELGLLNALALTDAVRFALALVLLDGWMYVWHRANHVVPFLWRFHRMHHSDPHMDVTTTVRFHLGEHVGAMLLRLVLIPLLGFEIWNLIVYDALVLAVTQFHHADISLGRWDRWVRLVIVTPDLHKVHHSNWRPETDSNYATVLSAWDRLAGSFRLVDNLKAITFGVKELSEATWQDWWGMWRTPWAGPQGDTAKHVESEIHETSESRGCQSSDRERQPLAAP